MSLTDGKKLSEIFASGPYKIPPFQRDYSWKKPQIIEFWNDTVDIFDSKESNYFFGPVVFIKNNDLSGKFGNISNNWTSISRTVQLYTIYTLVVSRKNTTNSFTIWIRRISV